MSWVKPITIKVEKNFNICDDFVFSLPDTSKIIIVLQKQPELLWQKDCEKLNNEQPTNGTISLTQHLPLWSTVEKHETKEAEH